MLALGACSSDDGADGDGDASSTTASTAADSSSGDDAGADDDASSDADADSGAGAVGTVEVDGEDYGLDQVTGVTSCDLDDPDGNLTVAAKSDAGDVFLRLDHFASDPDSDEFSVTVGEIEYVSESSADVVYTVEGQTVSGTIGVVPLFEEGTAQDVSFEVTCP